MVPRCTPLFEGKATALAPGGRTRRVTMARRGSKRDELLQVIRNGNGLSSGEFLENDGFEGE